MKKWIAVLLSLVLMAVCLAGCGGGTNNDNEATPEATAEAAETPAPETPPEATEEEPKEEAAASGTLILSTTTSTENSGLLDYLLPEFEKDSGLTVKTVAVGTGQAIQMGVDGEADVLLVHDKASEEKFVADGNGLERFDVMYNDFILIGPASDPAGTKANHGADIVGAYKAIVDKQGVFVSRGDDSGTHKMELRLWEEAGGQPQGDNYVSVGKGMGDTINMAEELQAYTLTDRATYLSMKDTLTLEVLCEGDVKLFNQYGVIAVNPEINAQINAAGAQAFVDWMLSDKAQKMINEFGVEQYGEQLFIANAAK